MQLSEEISRLLHASSAQSLSRIQAENEKQVLTAELERINRVLHEKLILIESFEADKLRLIEAINRSEAQLSEASIRAAQFDDASRTIEQLVAQIRERDARITKFSETEIAYQNLQYTAQHNESISLDAARKNEQLSAVVLELHQRVQTLESQLISLSAEASDAKVKRSRKEKDAEDLTLRVEYLSSELATKDARLRDLSTGEGQLRLLGYEKEQLVAERTQLTSYINALSAEKDNSMNQVVILSAAVEAAENTNKRSRLHIEALVSDLNQKSSETSTLMNSYKNLEAKMTSSWSERTTLE